MIVHRSLLARNMVLEHRSKIVNCYKNPILRLSQNERRHFRRLPNQVCVQNDKCLGDGDVDRVEFPSDDSSLHQISWLNDQLRSIGKTLDADLPLHK